MTSLNSILTLKINKVKSKKQNGFTLIELMVVVAIVGILSAVGLPELTKAQDRAKDSSAVATLTNAAKECSLNLLTEDATTAAASFAAKQVDGEVFADVDGDCEAGEALTLFSAAGDGATNQFTVTLDAGGIPNIVSKV